jgi:hypothetical protein
VIPRKWREVVRCFAGGVTLALLAKLEARE